MKWFNRWFTETYGMTPRQVFEQVCESLFYMLLMLSTVVIAINAYYIIQAALIMMNG